MTQWFLLSVDWAFTQSCWDASFVFCSRVLVCRAVHAEKEFLALYIENSSTCFTARSEHFSCVDVREIFSFSFLTMKLMVNVYCNSLFQHNALEPELDLLTRPYNLGWLSLTCTPLLSSCLHISSAIQSSLLILSLWLSTIPFNHLFSPVRMSFPLLFCPPHLPTSLSLSPPPLTYPFLSPFPHCALTDLWISSHTFVRN